ncbi:2Fe-2S iron-sulfur cluster-binding protein [Halostagnicola sp. A-GB9-2]|uniref:(2Fe-2S)-binding protein n=1 Tax=Halostagnicola sp. A-GB9-2 TaxID=3048066 RepID=UPI0024BFE33D|nr:2Fe-2S iron-sulfur cluster-binding protein [Halostagnicola sp. A-GB9-2]MDJ1434753.1 (2Fe-2S)-binding protein [Halostagnicola sp. A-GB9-2]
MSGKIVELTVNGRTVEEIVDPMEPLQSVLRNKLGNMATKTGCKQGGCGSCTVLVDGEPIVSCLLPAEAAVGTEITTLEGITPDDGLAPVQEAFRDHFAMQCGYCTPGMIMTAEALLERNPDPSRAEIEDAISGNVCRCTGYDPIVDAIEAASESMNGQGDDGA